MNLCEFEKPFGNFEHTHTCKRTWLIFTYTPVCFCTNKLTFLSFLFYLYLCVRGFICFALSLEINNIFLGVWGSGLICVWICVWVPALAPVCLWLCVHQRRAPSRQCCCRWGWGAPWWAAVAERPALIKGPRRGGGEGGGRGGGGGRGRAVGHPGERGGEGVLQNGGTQDDCVLKAIVGPLKNQEKPPASLLPRLSPTDWNKLLGHGCRLTFENLSCSLEIVV